MGMWNAVASVVAQKIKMAINKKQFNAIKYIYIVVQASPPKGWLLSNRKRNVDEDVEKLEHLFIAHRNVKCSHCGYSKN